MTTSQTMSFLDEPKGEDKISAYTLGYISETAREEVFDLVTRNCIEAGVSRAVLAKRLGKDPAQVTRTLQSPGNWTIDTISELLFAIDGRMLRVSSIWPLRENLANRRFANCLEDQKNSSIAKIENSMEEKLAQVVSIPPFSVGMMSWKR